MKIDINNNSTYITVLTYQLGAHWHFKLNTNIRSTCSLWYVKNYSNWESMTNWLWSVTKIQRENVSTNTNESSLYYVSLQDILEINVVNVREPSSECMVNQFHVTLAIFNQHCIWYPNFSNISVSFFQISELPRICNFVVFS